MSNSEETPDVETAEVETDETPSVETDEADDTSEETFSREYVEKLRKENARYRREAKAEREAAEKLKQQDATVEERLEAAEKRAEEAEARVLRKDIAIEHNLDKGDAELLDMVSDEDAMRTLAKRLAPKKTRGGRSADDGGSDGSGSTRGIRGTSTNGRRSGNGAGGDRDALGRALFG